MTPNSHHTPMSTVFHALRPPRPTLPVRLGRFEPPGLSRRELRDLVAEMLG